MPRRSSPYPTEAELEILNVLWQNGPSTVRTVHQTLQQNRHTTLTTTLKLLQTMTEKNITTRNTSRPHLYAPALRKEKTQAGLLLNLVRKAFHGSVSQLVMRAVEQDELTPEELRQIRQWMNRRPAQKGAK